MITHNPLGRAPPEVVAQQPQFVHSLASIADTAIMTLTLGRNRWPPRRRRRTLP